MLFVEWFIRRSREWRSEPGCATVQLFTTQLLLHQRDLRLAHHSLYSRYVVGKVHRRFNIDVLCSSLLYLALGLLNLLLLLFFNYWKTSVLFVWPLMHAPVLNFLWCLHRVSKPGWVLPLACFITCMWWGPQNPKFDVFATECYCIFG